jgi:hypothetical protein
VDIFFSLHGRKTMPLITPEAVYALVDALALKLDVDVSVLGELSDKLTDEFVTDVVTPITRFKDQKDLKKGQTLFQNWIRKVNDSTPIRKNKKTKEKIDPVNPVKVNPVKVNPVKINPVKVNPVKVNPVKVNPTKKSPVRANLVKQSEPIKSLSPPSLPSSLSSISFDPIDIDDKLMQYTTWEDLWQDRQVRPLI